MAGDPARRLHRSAAAVAHLLQRQILRLSAQGLRGAVQARHLRPARPACCPTPMPRRSRSSRRAPFTTGCATSSANGCFEIFFKTYTEKVWGMSCDEISADWAAQRIKGLDLTTAVINGLKRSLRFGRNAGTSRSEAGSETVKTLIESFQYPRKGPGMMWDAAARKIRAQDGRLLHGTRARRARIRRRAQSLADQGRDDDEGHETYTARHVISSAPLRELVERHHPDCRSRACTPARAALSRLPHRGADPARTNAFHDNWIYIHDPSVKVGRVQNFNSWSPEMVPDPGMTCLGLEYFCFEGDGLWNAADGELHRAGQERTGARSAWSPRRRGRRLRRAPAQGLSGLRRRLSRQCRDDPRLTSRPVIRRCTWSAATACTSTTTRITP